jgi:hypothetical protein
VCSIAATTNQRILALSRPMATVEAHPKRLKLIPDMTKCLLRGLCPPDSIYIPSTFHSRSIDPRYGRRESGEVVRQDLVRCTSVTNPCRSLKKPPKGLFARRLSTVAEAECNRGEKHMRALKSFTFDSTSCFRKPLRAKLCRRLGILVCSALAIAASLQGGVNGRESTSDPGSLGPYAVGHTRYLLTDTNNGNRPVSIMVWYPADPRSVSSSSPPAQYPLDPFTGTTYLPITLSTDWEPLGYDRAYEGLPPSRNGPFPLVVF